MEPVVLVPAPPKTPPAKGKQVETAKDADSFNDVLTKSLQEDGKSSAAEETKETEDATTSTINDSGGTPAGLPPKKKAKAGQETQGTPASPIQKASKTHAKTQAEIIEKTSLTGIQQQQNDLLMMGKNGKISSEDINVPGQFQKSDTRTAEQAVSSKQMAIQTSLLYESKTSGSSKVPSDYLARIQKIINSGDERGRVLIKGEPVRDQQLLVREHLLPRNLTQDTAQTIQGSSLSPTSGTATVKGAGENPITGEQLSKTAQLRSEITNHNVAAPEDNPSSRNDSMNQQSGENSGAPKQQSFSLNSSSSTTPLSQSSESVNFSSQFQQAATTQKATDTTIHASGTSSQTTVVQEQDVMNQVVQRFNVNPRLQTSKMTIQLHPAELGEIKVDVVVKGDGIRANIVAQSQKAQEIIDKHIVKLRQVLEGQGFNIEDLTVTQNDDSQQNSQAFQDNLAQSGFSKNNRNRLNSPSSIQNVHFNDTLREEINGYATTNISVKV